MLLLKVASFKHQTRFEAQASCSVAVCKHKVKHGLDLQSLMEQFATRKGTFCSRTNFVNQIIGHMTSEIITKIHKNMFLHCTVNLG